VQALERFGYDEAWIGEHHSGGAELICSPEVFIAAAAAKTTRIRLGTGVISLGYHHPLNTAERMVLLDHLTRGRVMMGVGPGALVIDAYMRGIDPADLRRRMNEGLETILALLKGDELVTRETDWFQIRDGHLHMRPYQEPCFEIAAAALISPSGPTLAARHGLSLLSIGATLVEGYEQLGVHWKVHEEVAAEAGTVPDRNRWRLLGPMHVAPTREQAMREVEYGIQEWVDYHTYVANLPIAPDARTPRESAERLVEIGAAAIGTPDDAAAQIQRLWDQTDGGFGTYLFMATDWADREATLRSYELFADEVMPLFQNRRASLQASWDWAVEAKPNFQPKAAKALVDATKAHYGAEHDRTKTVKDMLMPDAPAEG
jgi:limonene 1,2-monooxygenase